MVQDSQVLVLLTHSALLANLPESRAQVVCMDRDWASIARESDTTPVNKVTAENVAYIIYTSGSTGKPKGVLIEHSAIACHCLTIQDHYGLSATDRVLQFAALSFDPSLEQVLPTLASGATVILRDAALWTAEKALQRLAELKVTVANFPTAYWRQLLGDI